MRRITWWGTTASLAICLFGGSVRADEKDSYQSADRIAAAKKKEQADQGNGIFVWWFSDEAKLIADKKAADEARKTDTKKTRPTPNPLVGNEPLHDAFSLLSKEQAKFLRRQKVCDRLREVALENGDDELERQAELLEQRAWWLYEQRTAQAKMTILLPPMGDRDAKRNLASDEPATQKRNTERPVRTVKAENSGIKVEGEE